MSNGKRIIMTDGNYTFSWRHAHQIYYSVVSPFPFPSSHFCSLLWCHPVFVSPFPHHACCNLLLAWELPRTVATGTPLLTAGWYTRPRRGAVPLGPFDCQNYYIWILAMKHRVRLNFAFQSLVVHLLFCTENFSQRVCTYWCFAWRMAFACLFVFSLDLLFGGFLCHCDIEKGLVSNALCCISVFWVMCTWEVYYVYLFMPTAEAIISVALFQYWFICLIILLLSVTFLLLVP